jgi:hypothetical protein
MKLNTKNPSAPTHRRFILPLLPQTAALLLVGFTASAGAGEVAAFARVYSWPDGVNNFSTYTKAAGGSVTPAAAGNGWKSHASASFHALAAGGSGNSPGTAGFSRGYVAAPPTGSSRLPFPHPRCLSARKAGRT